MKHLRGNPFCEKCELHASARTVCLMGTGPVPAKVMIIGEAPGKEEDKEGKPFIGQSGKLLTAALEDAGIDRSEVYITNTVKCRPPENDTPKRKHIKACSEYLQDEIQAVNPQFIITLGAIALKSTPLSGKITFIHGNVKEEDGRIYLPTFHPAAALRDPKRLQPLRDDLKKFGRTISGEKEKKIELNIKVIKNHNDFADLADFISRTHTIASDSETTGLNRFIDVMNMIQFGNQFEQYILPLEIDGSFCRGNRSLQLEMMKYLAKACANKVMVWQNGKYDNLFSEHRYGVRFPVSFDTMLAAHLLDENQPVALDYIAKIYCDAPDYDIPLDIKQGKQGMTKELIEYSARDIYYTSLLKPILNRKLLKDPALYKVFRELTMPTSDAYIQAEKHGFYIYTARMGLVKSALAKQIKRVEEKLNGYAKEVINWNSPAQIGKILFGKLKLKPMGLTPGGAESTAESVLMQMRDQHPVIECLLERRGAITLFNMFMEGWEKRLQGKYLFPSYKIPGTVTGRPSSEDPNFQQVPRLSKIRTLVGAPKGWEFWEADYSQIELRVAAQLSGDRTMLQIFQTKGDIHSATASAASGIAVEDLTKEQRKSAKAINFGFVYGMGWRKFKDYARDKYDVHLTDDEAQDFRTVFFNKYYDLPDWHERQRRIVRSQGYVRTLTGRIRHLPEIYSPDKGMRAQAERQAINSPVQGFAAELTLMAFIEVQKKLDPRLGFATGTIHDAIVGRVQTGYAEELKWKVVEIMQDPEIMHRLRIKLSVPIVAEFKLGDWGS